MAARLGSAATAKAIGKLTATTGVNAALGELTSAGDTLAALDVGEIRAQNVAADLVEKSTAFRYPSANVYCERLVNDLKEKFRTFSGRAYLAIEVRHSQDRLDGLEAAIQTYADAVARTLDGNRGDWGDGMYYAGGYEIAYGPVKRGGRNYLQAATVKLAVEISR
jgi:hypothetical protein